MARPSRGLPAAGLIRRLLRRRCLEGGIYLPQRSAFYQSFLGAMRWKACLRDAGRLDWIDSLGQLFGPEGSHEEVHQSP